MTKNFIGSSTDTRRESHLEPASCLNQSASSFLPIYQADDFNNRVSMYPSRVLTADLPTQNTAPERNKHLPVGEAFTPNCNGKTLPLRTSEEASLETRVS